MIKLSTVAFHYTVDERQITVQYLPYKNTVLFYAMIYDKGLSFEDQQQDVIVVNPGHGVNIIPTMANANKMLKEHYLPQRALNKNVQQQIEPTSPDENSVTGHS